MNYSMTLKQWWTLLAFYISYLFLGASIFAYIEKDFETRRRLETVEEQKTIYDLLLSSFKPMNVTLQEKTMTQLSVYCGKPVTMKDSEEFLSDPGVWTFYHSFFFAFTVCSTLGYGNITPQTLFGRMFIIIYALIGLPVNTILFKCLAGYFATTFRNIYKRYRAYRRAANVKYKPKKWSLYMQITLYLILGMIVFIFVPSCIFTYFEDWPYIISIYYSFITLSTIGFGDFVPTFQAHQERKFGIYFIFYEIFVIVWFIAGLSYLMMIIRFLIQGLRSKKLAKIEKNLRVKNLRVWENLQREMSNLRQVLTEFKSFKLENNYPRTIGASFYRQRTISGSCPDLTEPQAQVTEPGLKKSQSTNTLQRSNSIEVSLENKRSSLKYDHHYSTSTASLQDTDRTYNPIDLIVLTKMIERVADSFDAKRRNSEGLCYQTNHGNRNGDLLRLAIEKEYLRGRAKSASMPKSSIQMVVQSESRQSMSSNSSKQSSYKSKH